MTFYYNRAQRDSAFELWYDSGQPAISHLRRMLKAMPETWDHVPSPATMSAWFEEDKWAQRAGERQILVDDAILDKVIERRKKLLDAMFDNGMLMLEAQRDIVTKADYANLTRNEARDLMPRIGTLGEVATTQLKEALDLVAQSGDASNPLNGMEGVMAMVERAAEQIRLQHREIRKLPAPPKDAIIDMNVTEDDIDNR